MFQKRRLCISGGGYGLADEPVPVPMLGAVRKGFISSISSHKFDRMLELGRAIFSR